MIDIPCFSGEVRYFWNELTLPFYGYGRVPRPVTSVFPLLQPLQTLHQIMLPLRIFGFWAAQGRQDALGPTLRSLCSTNLERTTACCPFRRTTPTDHRNSLQGTPMVHIQMSARRWLGWISSLFGRRCPCLSGILSSSESIDCISPP
jgi:hypothetical protein